ncbi:hypothetical protein ASPZODRAFT_77255 [Penicilliopsis zonata CBS 506.65]|uniref:FAD dependent oxidoreductase domain-containing protein n=1 Tax=Penicilliopsis zonata CBS 506.65 TaxID=1073090 RepID=A0A1L9S582_9EURO|nr:hypothetical protein ASPZODRAFT_77255 [Penicilliopsis zonata CBS 506.65]OJJ42311.1 hypothetical protein ASPZODRAFT_77255 [Penicilliopsis zonata CBS 506.65]
MSSPIIIVGAGAFGLSTALHLAQNGYDNVLVMDKAEQIPSGFSAANDLNKIVRAEYEDPFYTDLSLVQTQQAIAAWKTPLLAAHFHQTGFLHCVSENAPPEAVATLNRFQAAAERSPVLQPYLVRVEGAQAVRQHVWQYNEGTLPGWTGYLNRFDGYAHSADALRAVFRAAQAAGVRFLLGEGGAVTEVVRAGSGSGGGKIRGVRTAAGRFHAAERVIVAAGAAAGRLVPELGTQIVAKSWSVAHVQLTDDEASALRGIPVTYARDLGFFFEPDPATKLLKLCPMGGGIVNTDPHTGVSHAPDSLEASTGWMPADDEAKLRRLLAQTLPQLANRPLVHKSICWFADSKDSDFIIDYVPGSEHSLVMLSGDSGHGMKMFPLVGQWVRALLEAPDQRQPVARWRWKGNQNDEGNWGGAVSWRLGDTRELKDIKARL